MRSGIVAGLMGIGGMVLAQFARRGDARVELPAMIAVAVGSLVVGAVLFGAGFLLRLTGRASASP